MKSFAGSVALGVALVAPSHEGAWIEILSPVDHAGEA